MFWRFTEKKVRLEKLFLKNNFMSDLQKLRGFASMERFAKITNDKGEPVLNSAVDIEIVKSQDMDFKQIEAKGEKDPKMVNSPTIEESKDFGGEKLFQKYLEIIFRKFPGEIYRAGNVNERALGDRVKLTQGRGEYIYIIPVSLSEQMKKLLEEPVDLGVDDPGIEFSKMTGLSEDILDQNNLGFTRKMEINGQFFTVKFLYGQEKEVSPGSYQEAA